MARIETYPLDTSITPNDFLLGSDGDSLNATRNYRVSNLIEQIGRQYNLQSMDLIYTFNAVASGSVGDGEVSTNNYADATILASGVTNIYVSKLTLFGQLVDDYINTVGAAGLTVTFVDLSNYNNFAICEINGVSDVNANTLDVSVTVTTSNGSFSSGKTVGLKLDPAGSSVDLSGYVTLDTDQTITGSKTFTGINNFNGFITSISKLTLVTGFFRDNYFFGGGLIPEFDQDYAIFGQYTIGGTTKWLLGRDGKDFGAVLDVNSQTQNRVHTFQDKSGTLAHLDDVRPYQTLVGIISQSDTSDPSIYILEDTTDGFTWTRSDVGIIHATPDVPSTYSVFRTVVFVTPNEGLFEDLRIKTATSSSLIQFAAYDNGVLTDDVISGTMIEIRQYPT